MGEKTNNENANAAQPTTRPAAAPAVSPAIKLRKVRPPMGVNGLLNRMVKIGDDVEAGFELACKLSEHGEFIAIDAGERQRIEQALQAQREAAAKAEAEAEAAAGAGQAQAEQARQREASEAQRRVSELH